MGLVKKSIRTSETVNSINEELIEEFRLVFLEVVKDLSEYVSSFCTKDTAEWFEKLLHYTVPNGKMNRGLTTVLSFITLANEEDLTDENINLVMYLGWCIEMGQAMSLILDDIMDGSDKRRGKECWYKKEDVGIIAVNDAMLIKNGVYYMLKKKFGDKSYYIAMVNLVHEITFITTLGQCMDLNPCKLPVTEFTLERFNNIADYKTAYFGVYLPVALAMIMVGYTEPNQFEHFKNVLVETGRFFQIKNDIEDCFGDPQETGKVGTDIEEGKCTWLIAICLQRASSDQLKIIENCYGQKDPAKVQKIQDLYKELSIDIIFEKFEAEMFCDILSKIEDLPEKSHRELCAKILNKIC